ncbi:hypothetical protein SynSYN20_00843 [Synechococcus sp. SYN20]|uniref:hypothetical protein n=1 Tax=Synechococcus sp. SYN20 TaxID=1050714 RepID=UPI0016469604|nr:hypothetical protein [Synechococcus sp. SYN20]QNJ25185.1 hypothetical protein SynSYN20_00843 [Synechococcus sp. SYN20]
MSEHLSQLERAQLVADTFVPQESPGDYYVYIYLGKATYDASAYVVIDGQALMSKRIWHVDESQTNCVSYTGQGSGKRIREKQNHPVFPSSQLRLKVKEGISEHDSIELEKQIIECLGCICDEARVDGCLVNLSYYKSGPRVSAFTESHLYQIRKSSNATTALRVAAAIKATASDILCLLPDKTIIHRGSAAELARKLEASSANIINCCQGTYLGLWNRKYSTPLYFCYFKDYEDLKIRPMLTTQTHRHRLMIAKRGGSMSAVIGTASEISRHDLSIKRSNELHRVAQGKKESAYGWYAAYVSDLLSLDAFLNSSLPLPGEYRRMENVDLSTLSTVTGSASFITSFYPQLRGSDLHAVCRGKQKTHAGFTAQYID